MCCRAVWLCRMGVGGSTSELFVLSTYTWACPIQSTVYRSLLQAGPRGCASHASGACPHAGKDTHSCLLQGSGVASDFAATGSICVRIPGRLEPRPRGADLICCYSYISHAALHITPIILPGWLVEVGTCGLYPMVVCMICNCWHSVSYNPAMSSGRPRNELRESGEYWQKYTASCHRLRDWEIGIAPGCYASAVYKHMRVILQARSLCCSLPPAIRWNITTRWGGV